MIKYPETFEEIGRKDQILAANAKMQPLTSEDFRNGESPLKAYKPWSCLTLNFAVNSDGKSYGGSGSIEIKHIPDVKLRTQIMMNHIMEAETEKSVHRNASGDSEIKSLLSSKVYYLPKDMSGSRGKTAMEIAKLHGAAKTKEAALNLKGSASNNPKYAASNLKQAEALDLAAILVAAENAKLDDGSSILTLFKGDMNHAIATCKKLYEARHAASDVAVEFFNALNKNRALLEYIKSGQTNEETAKTYNIYGPVTKTPNVRKVDKDGLTKAYSLNVTCCPTHLPYPFRIELVTMRGVPIGADRVGVKPETVVDRKTFTMDLMTWEWINVIERADWEAKLVALDAHKEQYAASTQATLENIRKSGNMSVAQQTVAQPVAYGYAQPQQRVFPGAY